MPDVIGYGSAGMDLCLLLESVPVPDERCNMEQMSWQFGGTIGTGLCAAKMLGDCSCGLVSGYGGNVGELVKQDYLYHGIDVSRMIRSETGNSPLTIVMAFKDSNTRSFCGTGSTIPSLEEKDIDLGYLDTAKIIYVNRPDAGTLKAARYAKEHGIRVLIDADIRTEKLEELLVNVDYCISSEKCYRQLFPDGDIRENLKTYKSMCADGAVVIVTLGSKGLVGLDDEGYFEEPAMNVPVRDTSGCGDLFHGAYIAGLLRGMDHRTCAHYATGCSAIGATRIGCRAGIPTHQVLTKFLETGEIDYTEIDARIAHYAEMPLGRTK
jgi:sugar/nucleoside kinase (ribokinase family)